MFVCISKGDCEICLDVYDSFGVDFYFQGSITSFMNAKNLIR